MFFMTNEKYREGFTLEEYKGVYSINSVQKGTDDKEYQRWCKIELGKEKKEQSIPLGVKLGDKDMAIEALKAMLEELEPVPF